MGSLDRRISALERLYAMDAGPNLEPPDLEERRARLREDLERAREKAEREAAAGDSRRLEALRDLEQTFKARAEQRRERELEKGD
jgi:hypothetical protein